MANIQKTFFCNSLDGEGLLLFILITVSLYILQVGLLYSLYSLQVLQLCFYVFIFIII